MPSPSLSPSINSLLNDDASNNSLTPFTETDYFSTPAPAPAPGPSPARAPSPRPTKRPRTSSSASPQLAMHPPPAPLPPPARPTSASSSSSSSSLSRARPLAPPPPPPPSALEPSIFNVEPIDEFTREVADWLWGFCAPLDWDKVEIEAKIGLLVDHRQGGQRVYLPVPTEAILTDDTGLRFQSNMTVSQHKHFNQLLNARVVETSHPSLAASQSRIAYSHTHELDSFHTTPDRRKIRVTRNVDDKKRPPSSNGNGNGNGTHAPPARDWRAIEKVRVADMNVFSPKRCFDWRVSISLENPVTEHPTTPASHSRRKDRISYSHQLYTVDLTQVTTPDATNPAAAVPPTHELEIEFKDAKKLLLEAEKESRGEKNWYLQGVQGLLNNVRMLIRNASDP
ncbi:hypothetical protein JCM11491_003144 [Sporobolomyces phaffii]